MGGEPRHVGRHQAASSSATQELQLTAGVCDQSRAAEADRPYTLGHSGGRCTPQDVFTYLIWEGGFERGAGGEGLLHVFAA